ncbi:YhgE/Pip domain-containing protein [Miniphocaeibacter massiliensis]|uniref:YhgE/Pip domain-containing protein n=1 Tax=Miniphocaeibacter massiliensis TaxID=2041841 RepID=UPI000C1BD81B|nr:ABC transporter permease [Miniphocaeibacter massiliensis]
MKNKKIQILLIALLALLMGIIGFIIGSKGNVAKEREVNSLVNSSNVSEQENTSRIIAVVNLDEGIIKNDKLINYASEISRFPSNNFYSTSLEEAKRGISSGKYGAYIVIPSTFSNNVESLNNDIQKSKIAYTISDNLNEEVNLKVREEIDEYTDELNNGVSYLYVNSILEEFQGAQTAIGTVLTNNTKGNEALLLVEPADLLANMNIPELKEPNPFVETVDIENEVSQNGTLLESMISEYQSGLETGQGIVTDIVLQGNNLIERAQESLEEFSQVKIGYDSEDKSKFKYEDAVEEISKELQDYLDNAAIWAGQVTGSEFLNIKSVIQSVDHYYKEEGSPYDEQVMELVEYYSSLDIKLGNTKKDIAKANIDNNLLVLRNSNGDSRSYTMTEVTDPNTQEVMYMLKPEDVINIINTGVDELSEINTTENTSIIIKDKDGKNIDINNPKTHRDKITDIIPKYSAVNFIKDEATNSMVEDIKDKGKDRLEAAVKSIEKLEKLAVDNEGNPLREEKREAIIESVKDGLKLKVADKLKEETDSLNEKLIEKTDELTKETDNFINKIREYDPFSSLDQASLNEKFTSMQENNSSIQSKTAEHIVKMSENMLENYMLYGENQVSLLDEAQKATEEGADKVTGGLSSAKETLTSLMDQNKLLLSPITSKLAYAKEGDIPNYYVYQYIVSPLTISEDIESKNRLLDTNKADNNDIDKNKVEKKTSDNKFIKVFAIIFILLILITVAIIIFISKKKKTKLKW